MAAPLVPDSIHIQSYPLPIRSLHQQIFHYSAQSQDLIDEPNDPYPARQGRDNASHQRD